MEIKDIALELLNFCERIELINKKICVHNYRIEITKLDNTDNVIVLSKIKYNAFSAEKEMLGVFTSIPSFIGYFKDIAC